MWWIAAIIILLAILMLRLFLSGVEPDDDEDVDYEKPPIIKRWNEDDDIDIRDMTEREEPDKDK